MKKIFQNIKQRAKNKKGFTLLETLVAIFILTLALTGPIYIASLAIRSSVETRDNISAYYLAEEAVEAIRNMRDTNSFKGISYGWLGDSLTSPLSTKCRTAPCIMGVDYEGVYYITECENSTCSPLTFDPQGTITYGGPILDFNNMQYSKFTREITFEDITPERELLVKVAIKWEDKGRQRKFEIEERLLKQDYERYYADDK